MMLQDNSDVIDRSRWRYWHKFSGAKTDPTVSISSNNLKAFSDGIFDRAFAVSDAFFCVGIEIPGFASQIDRRLRVHSPERE